MKDLVFLPAAETDIRTAYAYYEHSEAGRGAAFTRQLDAAFRRLRAFPEIGPPVQGIYRRLLVSRFPYGVFYALEEDRIVVAGVLDLRQNPHSIRERLAG